MEREAGDGIEHGLARGVERDVGREAREQVCERIDPPLVDQQRGGAVARRPGEHGQHHLALGDEGALPADEIALADIAIGGDARIGGVEIGIGFMRRGATAP